MKQRPLLQMTTFRSGSTPIHRLLSCYLEQTRGVESLDAFFDPWELGYREVRSGIEIVRPRPPKLGPKLFSKMPLYSPRRIEDRLVLLRRHYRKYFIKTHPLTGEAMNWLLETHDFIFTERLDLPAQIVSYLISCAYGRWYRKDGLFPDAGSLTARREWFAELEVSLGKYFALKALVKTAPVITYEDFLRRGPEDLLAAAGLRQTWDSRSLSLPSKQNRSDFEANLKTLRNHRAVKSWYKNSYLQTLRPWPL